MLLPLFAALSYQLPPQPMIDLVDAPATPVLNVGPNRRTALQLTRQALLGIHEVAAPELRLAGLRLDPRLNAESRQRRYEAMALLQLPSGTPLPIHGLPARPRIEHVMWAPDGRHVAFSLAGPQGLELWTLDVAARRAGRLGRLRLNALGGAPFHWLPDGRALIARAIPAGRGPAPADDGVPKGPVTQESFGRKAPAPTYADMLKDPQDEALFAYHMQAQVERVELSGRETRLGSPDLLESAAPSPDGNFVLVRRLHRPFSYKVPYQRFPVALEIWDARGRKARTLADLPLAETIPISFDAVRPGPRQLEWRGDAPATLAWAEAQDGGDPARPATVRDVVYTFPAPFRGKPWKLAELAFHMEDVAWSSNHLALVTEGWWKTRRTRTWIVEPGVPGAKPRLLWDRSSEDHYGDPGKPLLKRDARGQLVLATTGNGFYLEGEGASPRGSEPFLAKVALPGLERTVLWRSAAPHYEFVSKLLDEGTFLTSREGVAEPPNYFLHDGKTERQVTRFANPSKPLAGIHKALITYQRNDGVKLSGKLYTPAGWTPAQGPLPMLMWAYPREFKSADAAGQVVGSPFRFDRISGSSPLFWLTQGYAVLDDPALPIVGAGTAEPNDTYVQQLTAGAQAAVDEVVRRGVADRRRIAVGGHSYGAFMTANLLAHTQLFAAGIARSGAYNRTLTPFGFQGEERTFWQAEGTYGTMSPFNHAAAIKAPLLLIHGMADNNQGTNPIQSERLFAAVSGLGGNVRLVMLPAESHGYQARESTLHVLWEMTRWLDQHVKHRPEEKKL
ncbi:MAG: aminoacyl peptidase [Cyanobacteria bacterium RYN_339]|nr:aminoacyl peptidase [Cyanobacteria bacterium RYN_339]